MALLITTASAAGVPVPMAEGPLVDSARQGTLVWNVDKLGYVAEEYLISGRADVFDAVAMADAVDMTARDTPKDMAARDSYSRVVLKAAEPYITRIIVYRPEDPARFSGNVVVETAHPLQGGLAIVWSQISGYFAQHGDIYVGIAHPVTFASLRASNPSRYGQLSAVDPTQLWGMIAQVGALIKAGGSASPLRRFQVKALFLTGYSYTGVAATTFADFHHESVRLADGRPIFDGYLSMANSMYVRPIDVPVIRLMTQSDFNSFGGLNNRRPDSDAPGSRFRLWEVAGASHLNASPVIEPAAEPWIPAAAMLEPPNLPHFSASECSKSFPSGFGPNTLPLNYVMVSAFEHLYALGPKRYTAAARCSHSNQPRRLGQNRFERQRHRRFAASRHCSAGRELRNRRRFVFPVRLSSALRGRADEIPIRHASALCGRTQRRSPLAGAAGLAARSRGGQDRASSSAE
jgi:hypothetical protein